MAGARPSSFKKGGGFLDGVDSTIVDVVFTDEYYGKDGPEEWKAGKIPAFDGKGKIDKPHPLNVFLTVRPDGATEDTTLTLKAAKEFDDWTIENDGHTVVPATEGVEFTGGTAWSKFIETLVKPTDGGEGFPEDRLPEDEINYEAAIGTRIRTVQRTDAERTKKYGQKKNKKGQAFDRKDLVVETVYELPEVETKSNGKAAKPGKAAVAARPTGGKTATTTTTTSRSSGKVSKKEDTDDVAEVAEQALLQYLAAADGSIAKSKVRMRVLTDKQFAGKDNLELKENVIKWLSDDDNLEGIENVVYKRSDKSGMIVVADA